MWFCPLLALTCVASVSATATRRGVESGAFERSFELPQAVQPPPTWLSSCASSGFAPGLLACRTCKLISDALGSDHISTAACESCCSKALDVVDGPLGSKLRVFDSAELRVCREAAEGGVSEWLTKASPAWLKRGDVTIERECLMGKSATLVLTLEGVANGIVVPVHAWRHEDISSFLESSLSSRCVCPWCAQGEIAWPMRRKTV